jgi:hypothetical protein
MQSKTKLILFLLQAASLFLSVSRVHASEWIKISDDQGIKVFQKKDVAEGTGVSFRGETLIAAEVEDILRVMADNSKAHRWIPLVQERRDLKQINENERIEYTHVNMPWPLTDRYFINRAKAERLPDGQMRIFVQSVPTPNAEWLEKEKVLGFLHYSEIMLSPQESESKTRMVIEINSDPKGLIPKFLVNAAQKSWPTKFFTGLNIMLKEAGVLKVDKFVH